MPCAPSLRGSWMLQHRERTQIQSKGWTSLLQLLQSDTTHCHDPLVIGPFDILDVPIRHFGRASVACTFHPLSPLGHRIIQFNVHVYLTCTQFGRGAAAHTAHRSEDAKYFALCISRAVMRASPCRSPPPSPPQNRHLPTVLPHQQSSKTLTLLTRRAAGRVKPQRPAQVQSAYL